jgi:hypothetical protein
MASSNYDVKLSNGKEIKFDLAAITIEEYRKTADKKTPRDEEDRIIAKAAGITVNELVKLPVLDYKRLWKAFYPAFTKPLEDDPDSPN